MKLSIDEVEGVLVKSGIEKDKVIKVIKNLQEIAAELQKEKEETKEPKGKNQFIIVISDPAGQIKEDVTGWVIQIPQNDDPATILPRLQTAMMDQNAAAKRKKLVFNSIGDIICFVKRKFVKEKNVLIKTKVPVRVIVTDNKLTSEAVTPTRKIIL